MSNDVLTVFPMTPDEEQALAWYQTAKDDAFARGRAAGLDESIELLESEISCDLNDCQACEGLVQAVNLLKSLRGERVDVDVVEATRAEWAAITERFPEVEAFGDE